MRNIHFYVLGLKGDDKEKIYWIACNVFMLLSYLSSRLTFSSEQLSLDQDCANSSVLPVIFKKIHSFRNRLGAFLIHFKILVSKLRLNFSSEQLSLDQDCANSSVLTCYLQKDPQFQKFSWCLFDTFQNSPGFDWFEHIILRKRENDINQHAF